MKNAKFTETSLPNQTRYDAKLQSKLKRKYDSPLVITCDIHPKMKGKKSPTTDL